MFLSEEVNNYLVFMGLLFSYIFPQGAPGRMGQQGDPGIAGYEVSTSSLK